MSGSGEELSDSRRTQGKGDNRDESGSDPANRIVDDPESDQAEDAQATLDEITADLDQPDGQSDSDGTPPTSESGERTAKSVRVGGESDTDSGGTIEDASTVGEDNRFGLASDPAVLQDAFEQADEVTHSREAGIEHGDTTADQMDVLTMEDGSRVFATDLSAYDDPEGRMSKEEGITNNLQSPKVIEALGGNSCKATVIEDADGTRYIAKEGVEGQLVADVDLDTVDEATLESAEDASVAGYFVGNNDLHQANVVITEEGSAVIIDNDFAGEGPSGTVVDIEGYTTHSWLVKNERRAREKIYETAHRIKAGEQPLGVDEGTDHYEYAHRAAEKAIRASVVDSQYEAPSETRPAEMQSKPDGVDSVSDFEKGDEVRYVTRRGDIRTGTVTSVTSRSLSIEANVGVDTKRITKEDQLRDIVEV